MTTSPHPLVVQARRLAAEVLAPQAERVDQEGVPASSIEAIKRSGLLGVSAPVAYGGSGAPNSVARETAEILAGACCSTWFVQTQHYTPVLTLVKSELPAREGLLRKLATGELLSGVAYAHLRRYPQVPVRAVPKRGGWRFHGTVPWYTGWGLNDVMLLAGVTDADEVVFAFTEARQQSGLEASAPMRLAALTAARTVSLHLDGLWIPDDAVALHAPYESWAASDRPKPANASPAVFGVAESALGLLDQDDPTTKAAATAAGQGATAGVRPGRPSGAARAHGGAARPQDEGVRPDAHGDNRRGRRRRRTRPRPGQPRPTPGP